MKKLYLIGGTMGVGKTTTCQVLKTKLDKSVFLDGDWCWDMHSFIVNEETKKFVLENFCMLLNNDLKCSVFEHILFCWVMHEQSIIDDLLSHLDLKDVKVISISLVFVLTCFNALIEFESKLLKITSKSTSNDLNSNEDNFSFSNLILIPL